MFVVKSASDDSTLGEFEGGKTAGEISDNLFFKHGYVGYLTRENVNLLDDDVVEAGDSLHFHQQEEYYPGDSESHRREIYTFQPHPLAWSKCRRVLTELKKVDKEAWAFYFPVTTLWPELKHFYPTKISKPMDLGSVQHKLNSWDYTSLGKFASDVRLTLNNALEFNRPGEKFHTMAERMLVEFEEMFKEIKRMVIKNRPVMRVRSTTSVTRPPPIAIGYSEKLEIANILNTIPLSLEHHSKLIEIVERNNVGMDMESESVLDLDIEALDEATLFEVFTLAKKVQKEYQETLKE